MAHFIDNLLTTVSGPVAYFLVFLVPALEASVFAGRRFGQPLQQSRLGRIVGQRRWRAAEDFLRRRGGPAVLLGRWTALLRALIPAAAGMAGLRYRTFLAWNVTGEVLQATAIVIAGYLAGNAYKRIEHYLGRGALALLALIVAAFVARHYWTRRRREGGPG